MKTSHKLGRTIVFSVFCSSVVAGAAPPSGAKPGTLETYRDWTIGCDNGSACQAASLMREDESDWDSVTAIIIARAADASAQPQVTFRLQSKQTGPIDIMVDGAKVGSATAKDEEAQLAGPAATSAIIALAKGMKLELRAGSKIIAHASLSGSSAALRYMDAKQGRAGTITALVAKGKLSASAVKPPPPLPLVLRVAVPLGGKGAALWREELGQATKLSGCTDEGSPVLEAEVHPLSANQNLVLIPCGAGAYNFSSVPLIATGKVGRRTFEVARFDHEPGWGVDAKIPMLVNAGWEAKDSALTSYVKGRGLGDCGSAQHYAWDGRMLRLTLASAMGECRGAWDWITVFRARVALIKK